MHVRQHLFDKACFGLLCLIAHGNNASQDVVKVFLRRDLAEEPLDSLLLLELFNVVDFSLTRLQAQWMCHQSQVASLREFGNLG